MKPRRSSQSKTYTKESTKIPKIHDTIYKETTNGSYQIDRQITFIFRSQLVVKYLSKTILISTTLILEVVVTKLDGRMVDSNTIRFQALGNIWKHNKKTLSPFSNCVNTFLLTVSRDWQECLPN